MVESEAKELSEETHARGGHDRPSRLPAGDRRDHPSRRARRQGPARPRPRRQVRGREGASPQIAEAELREAYKITVKQERYAAVDAVKAKVTAALFPEGGEAKFTKEHVGEAFKELQAKVVRWNILDTGIRIDGRDVKTVRPIVAEVGVLPRTHGSALFTRGETQALVVATLGTGEDEQYRRLARGHLQGALPAPLQLPSLFASARPAAWVRPAAARSATASSPGAPSARCCRRPPNSPTRCASSRRSPSRTAPRRWRPSAAPRWR